MIKQWITGLLSIGLLTALSISTMAQDAPSTVKAREINNWKVMPAYQEKDHFAFIKDHPTRLKILCAGIGFAIGAIIAIKTSPHCNEKFYDGKPYSGVNVPCPK